MAQTIDQIEDHIEWTRDQLGSDFRELEQKVSAATDVRAHYERVPAVFLGAAALGGVLLAAALSRKRTPRLPTLESHELRALGSGHAPSGASDAPNKTRQLVNNVTAALVGLGAARLTAYIDSVLPGFDEHYRRVEHHS